MKKNLQFATIFIFQTATPWTKKKKLDFWSQNRWPNLWLPSTTLSLTQGFLNFFMPKSGKVVNTLERATSSPAWGLLLQVMRQQWGVWILTLEVIFYTLWLRVSEAAVEWNNSSFSCEPGVCCRPSIHYCDVDARRAVSVLVLAAVVISWWTKDAFMYH